jgi:hypothetical protein
MTRPLSTRSRTYLAHIANYVTGYAFHIPFSTEMILRNARLIEWRGEREFGRDVLYITDAGRKVLAQPAETPVPILIRDEDAAHLIRYEGYLNARGRRALAAWRQSKTGI